MPARRDWNPSRWLRILLPALVLIVWLVVAGFGGPTFGKLSSVSTNDQAAYLPASAESTVVQNREAAFTDSTAIPAIVVFESDEPIATGDLASYAGIGRAFAATSGVAAPTPPATTAVIGPIPSADRKAVEFIVPISNTNGVQTVVADLRTIVSDHTPSGVTGYVTGPAGFTADLVSAFGGIDGILLFVAVGAVFVILLLVYRSLILPFLVLFTSVFALTAAILIVYAFASWGWITLNGQSQGILSILVIGAATDYSLLLVARYREALGEVQSKWTAIGRAWRAAVAPIVASGSTVIIALLCLLFSDLNSNKSLGPIAAIGIVFSLLAALTLLPTLLVVFGRVAFWPFRPRVAENDAGAVRHAGDAGSADVVGGRPHRAPLAGLEGIRGLWRFVGTVIAGRPRLTWAVALLVLVVCVLGLPQLKANGVSQSDVVLSHSDAAAGQKALARHFDAGSGSPVVIIADSSKAESTLAAVKATSGISSASIYTGAQSPQQAKQAQQPVVKNGTVLIDATLTGAADSDAAEGVVRDLRMHLPKVDPTVLVGGVTAIALDTNDTAQSDLAKIIPLVLVVILLILMLLLRAVLAPVLLVASVVISYAASLGVSAVVFNHLLRFPGADASVPLFGFVFLVALGVDYNIFLMTRVREESLARGTRPGILRGLGVTGSVITSAGVVLAATFAALAVIPILFLVQIAFIVAFGVLLDTIVVRSLLVPALSYDIGRAIWWPSALWRADRVAR